MIQIYLIRHRTIWCISGLRVDYALSFQPPGRTTISLYTVFISKTHPYIYQPTQTCKDIQLIKTHTPTYQSTQALYRRGEKQTVDILE